MGGTSPFGCSGLDLDQDGSGLFLPLSLSLSLSLSTDSPDREDGWTDGLGVWGGVARWDAGGGNGDNVCTVQ